MRLIQKLLFIILKPCLLFLAYSSSDKHNDIRYFKEIYNNILKDIDVKKESVL